MTFYFYCRLLETHRVAWSLPVRGYPLKEENGFQTLLDGIRITWSYQTVSASESLSSNGTVIAVRVLRVSGASICGITPGLLAAELPYPLEKSSLTFLLGKGSPVGSMADISFL